MDSFDWNELLKAVDELGHGAVKFELKDSDGVELEIDTIVIDDEEVLVTMNPVYP